MALDPSQLNKKKGVLLNPILASEVTDGHFFYVINPATGNTLRITKAELATIFTGVDEFINLIDTPESYTPNRFVKVNTEGNALIFTLLAESDVPNLPISKITNLSSSLAAKRNNEVIATANLTAVMGTDYKAQSGGTITFTDPSELGLNFGDSFRVIVLQGSAVVGGVTYPSGTIVYRIYTAPATFANVTTTVQGLGALAFLSQVNNAQIVNEAVTLAKIQNVPSKSWLARFSPGVGSFELQTTAQVKTELNLPNNTVEELDGKVDVTTETNSTTISFTHKGTRVHGTFASPLTGALTQVTAGAVLGSEVLIYYSGVITGLNTWTDLSEVAFFNAFEAPIVQIIKIKFVGGRYLISNERLF